MISSMEMESKFSQTELSMKGCTLKARSMEMELTFLLMGAYTLEIFSIMKFQVRGS